MKAGEKLAQLGITLPAVAAPVANYVPAVRTGNAIYTSGQLPFENGKLTCTGKVPVDADVARAAAGARTAMLNAVAAAAQAAGGIDRISRVVKVGVFVSSAAGFTEQPKVANGASDLLVEIFGDAGRHARAAVGVAELPLNAAVEVDLIVEVGS
ncbi:MAG: RidA family protein [Phycisphaerales bacterium]|nr:RidA family protein [Phycisphaerales bacterium]